MGGRHSHAGVCVLAGSSGTFYKDVGDVVDLGRVAHVGGLGGRDGWTGWKGCNGWWQGQCEGQCRRVGRARCKFGLVVVGHVFAPLAVECVVAVLE